MKQPKWFGHLLSEKTFSENGVKNTILTHLARVTSKNQIARQSAEPLN